MLSVTLFPLDEIIAIIFDRRKRRRLIFEWQHGRLEVERRILGEFVIFLEVQSLGFLLAVLIKDVTYARLMPVFSVAIQVKEVLGSLGGTEQVLLWQEVEHLPALVGIAGHRTAQKHLKTAFAVLNDRNQT